VEMENLNLVYNIRRTINYVGSTLRANRKRIEEHYISRYNPFYKWRVGQLEERDILVFLLSYFGSGSVEKDKLFKKYEKIKFLIESLLSAVKEHHHLKVGSDEIEPSDIQNMGIADWVEIRKAFTRKLKILKTEEWLDKEQSIVGGKSIEVSLDTSRPIAFKDDEELAGLTGEEAINDDVENSKKPTIATTGPFRGENRREDYEGNTSSTDDEISEETEIDPDQKNVYSKEKFLIYSRNKLNDHLTYDSESLFIEFQLSDPDRLVFRFLIAERNFTEAHLPSLEFMGEEVKVYLNELYLDVTVGTQIIDLGDGPFFCVRGQFMLEIIPLTSGQYVRGYFVKGDNVFLELD
jgi:hypothetical protein